MVLVVSTDTNNHYSAFISHSYSYSYSDSYSVYPAHLAQRLERARTQRGLRQRRRYSYARQDTYEDMDAAMHAAVPPTEEEFRDWLKAVKEDVSLEDYWHVRRGASFDTCFALSASTCIMHCLCRLLW